jgi:branched-chain amino acid transport system permease protein
VSKGKISSHYIVILIVGIVLVLLSVVIGHAPYLLRLGTLMLIYMTCAVAFNIIFGHTGQLFLCQGALAGSSAFFSVVLIRELAITWWVAISFGALLSAAIGASFSYVSVRRGLGVIFVGIITLAFTVVFHTLILGLRRFTGGELGIVIRELGPGVFQNLSASYYIFLAILLLALLFYHFLVSSRIGLAFRALSDDELSAELAGIDVTRYKVLAASIGSALLGIMGSLYGYYNAFINADVFSLANIDVVVMVMLFFGGRATLLGPVAGGIVFTVVEELVRPLGALSLLVYGVFLVGLFLTFREGLVMALRKTFKLHIP